MFKNLNNTNTRNTVRIDVDTQTMEFAPIKDFIGQTVKVDGFFFTKKGRYGEQVVVVGNNKLINMPKRAVEQFKTIYNDDELLNAVLEGHLAITKILPLTTKNGTTTIYELTDI